MEAVKLLLKGHFPNSYTFGVKVFFRFGGKGSVTELINESINDKGVYRTAPVTPGLLKT